MCSVDSFGLDPSPGVFKTCECGEADLQKGVVKDDMGLSWSRCASEGGECPCASGTVRFGSVSRPTRVSFMCMCAEKGKRQLKILWTAPRACASAPVHKYVLAVADPSNGKVLTIATLEPDYSKEHQRYLSFDDPDLCTYVISESDLRKMPKLFKAESLTVHVAAGNREGLSDWSKLKVCLKKLRLVKKC